MVLLAARERRRPTATSATLDRLLRATRDRRVAPAGAAVVEPVPREPGDLAGRAARAERALELSDDSDGPWTGALVRAQLAGLTHPGRRPGRGAASYARDASRSGPRSAPPRTSPSSRRCWPRPPWRTAGSSEAERIFDEIAAHDAGSGIFGAAIILLCGRAELDLARATSSDGLRLYREAVDELADRCSPGMRGADRTGALDAVRRGRRAGRPRPARPPRGRAPTCTADAARARRPAILGAPTAVPRLPGRRVGALRASPRGSCAREPDRRARSRRTPARPRRPVRLQPAAPEPDLGARLAMAEAALPGDARTGSRAEHARAAAATDLLATARAVVSTLARASRRVGADAPAGRVDSRASHLLACRTAPRAARRSRRRPRSRAAPSRLGGDAPSFIRSRTAEIT